MRYNHQLKYYCHICDKHLTLARSYDPNYGYPQHLEMVKRWDQERFAMDIYKHIKEHGRIKETISVDNLFEYGKDQHRDN